MLEHPRVVLAEDAAVPQRSIQVVAELTNTQGSDVTQVMSPTVIQSAQARKGNALLLLQTPHGPQPLPLESTTLTIGRGLSNDVILEDARVSRHHAQLRYRARRFWVTDLGSTNGTFVNGERISETGLRDGDVISLGGLEMTFKEG
jgi:pSer/pThr/pTyr-binding forkhead associated (FHA) protein